RLLAGVAAGQIDVVVVYKVDRLTRSLSDFAKIVEIFDKRQVSFVSVTQAFNTTTSMGRLTLNVLLSFAQFEREVTGERIRDKIAASKRKGMWMGGQPPLGYDAKDRKLVVNEAEAELVRHIFGRYRELKSVRLLKTELDGEGILSKVRLASDGSRYGGRPLARGALYLMLANRIYRGEIVHKGQSYPGDHGPIVDEPLWNEVQQILSANRVDRETGASASEPSLLAGLAFDAAGERLTPTHAVKKGTRYRYYVSQALITGSAQSDPKGQRIPAASLEALVKNRLRELLVDPSAMFDATQGMIRDAADQRRLMARAGEYVARWAELERDELRQFLLATVPRIQVLVDRIEISLDTANLLRWLLGRDADPGQISPEAQAHVTTLSVPARLKRTGLEMRFVIDGRGRCRPDPDPDQGSRGPWPPPAGCDLERRRGRARGEREPLLRDPPLALDVSRARHRLRHSYRTPSAGADRAQAHGRHARAAGLERTAQSARLCLIPGSSRLSGAPRGPFLISDCAPARKLGRPPYHQSARGRRSRPSVRRLAAHTSLGGGPTNDVPQSPGKGGGILPPRKQKAECYRILRSWRRERDSNPRYGFPYTRVPGVRLQPLGHPGHGSRLRCPRAFR
ncbi:MAG: putative resolvase, partial [Microvirga sp.]|nr:putative resolvase [Microvirga sp.]